jgi:nifR3 family TIM-barrel protein
MTLLPRDQTGCPFLILAPMEGVGDRSFRKAMGSVGGFDEAVRDFLRVPRNGHPESLARIYDPTELGPIPLAAQLMGSDLELMSETAKQLEKRGAHRIDLNCGCPSNTVTGRGAGSSLLKEPDFLHQVAKSLVQSVSIPVTLKMRSGFEDTTLFRENLKAAEESGVRYITLHPRTKVDGYGPPARWDLIAEAKSVLKIPLVGNGDILSVDDALRMLSETGCDALMIGRGAVTNPFLFHQIRAHFTQIPYIPMWDKILQFFAVFRADIPDETSIRIKINKLKQLMSFFFKGNPQLLEMRQGILTATPPDPETFMEFALPQLKKGLNL